MTSYWRRFAAWLGALTIGLHALLPVDAMPAPTGGDLFSGICTSEGFRAAGGSTQAPQPLMPAHDHAQCAHCAPCAFWAAAGPPSTIGSFQPPTLRRGARLGPTRTSAPPTRSWNPSAPPRAPPAPPAVS